jgi:hypothetical protein
VPANVADAIALTRSVSLSTGSPDERCRLRLSKGSATSEHPDARRCRRGGKTWPLKTLARDPNPRLEIAFFRPMSPKRRRNVSTRQTFPTFTQTRAKLRTGNIRAVAVDVNETLLRESARHGRAQAKSHFYFDIPDVTAAEKVDRASRRLLLSVSRNGARGPDGSLAYLSSKRNS